MFKVSHPHCDGSDVRFDTLGGTWRGLISHAANCSHGSMPSVPVGGTCPVDCFGIIQFICVFPTDLAASEYTRIMIETENIGEEGPFTHAKEEPCLTKKVKQYAKACGVKNLRKTHVIIGQFIPGASIVAVVGNVSTKIFVHLRGDELEQAVCFLAGRALAYLERQLLEYRATSSTVTRQAPYHPPDLTICAYCGNTGEDNLKSCSRCSLSRYCSVDCQRAHWEMKGKFGHKEFCKSIGKKSETK